MPIVLRYSAVDGTRHQPRAFDNLADASSYAVEWVGATPEVGSNYAVSWDGVGKITVGAGCQVADLFPALGDGR